MAQIQAPYTFVTGDQVTAANLNAHTNSAILLPGAITDQPNITANTIAAGDSVALHDLSDLTLKEATVGDLLNSGINITTGSIAGVTGANLVITPAATFALSVAGNLSTTANFAVTGTSILTGNVTANGDLTVAGNASFNSVESLKLPTGTTAQRPATAQQGAIRYNSTTLGAEVYNGTTWEAVGGGPFDGTGGNKVIAPDAISVSPTTATFTSADGQNVVVTSSGHSVIPGQVVSITTSITGYSGEYTVVSANAGDFTYVMNIVAAPSGGSCTYKKVGKFKCHIFTSNGAFVTGDKAGVVQILVIGGGGGGNNNCGGGGGGVQYWENYRLDANTTYYVTIGAGGAPAPSNLAPGFTGGSSIFGPITAFGGGGAFYGASFGLTNNNWGGQSGPSNLKTSVQLGGVAHLAGTQAFNGGGGGGAGFSTNGNSFTTGGRVVFTLTPGGQGIGDSGGNGGAGFGTTITGVYSSYAGGGGGYTTSSLYGLGLNGGGNSGSNGTANTGGGGGNGASGGSGIVIVRYPYWI
jgi:hypothetical protein